MVKPRISLVIPAYNEAGFIGRCLESVEKAKHRYRNPCSIETIVVNNCSTDDTERIALRHNVRVVPEQKRQIALARNKGVSVATGDIVGFLDADSTVSSNIFLLIDQAMSSGRYIGGGTDLILERNSPGIFCTYCITKFPAMWLLGITGGLLFTNRKTFEEVGGFDESLYCAEDVKFALDLKRYGKEKGKKFRIITRAYVISSARSFDKFGDWFYFKNLPRVLLSLKKITRDREFCDKFWYNVRT